MTKFLVAVIIIMIVSFAACLYLPWWSIAIVAMIVAYITGMRAARSFLAGFLSIFILWVIISAWISNNNGHLLAHKVSQIILKIDNPFLLILVSGLVGGIVAGCGAITGSYLKTLFFGDPEKSIVADL